MHLLDAIAIGVGLLLLVMLAGGLSPADAAVLSAAHPAGPLSQTLMGILGAGFTTFPVTRRLAYRHLIAADNLAECDDVGQALQRLAMQQRVQAGNLYLVDLPEDSILRAFDGDEGGVWAWLAPAYADPALRRQFDPRLLARLDAIAAG
ncbi:MAG TPA: hypothetical protein VK558_16120 [Patescibacteria group bacterium]|nr:hypothetical protein [Patescibacteria group bacterium]